MSERVWACESHSHVQKALPPGLLLRKVEYMFPSVFSSHLVKHVERVGFNIQGVTGGKDQTSGGCSLC